MKSRKLALTVGSAALILSGAAWADPPAAFDVWSATTGTINFGDYDTGTAGTQTCPTGYTCGTPVTGSGFLQRQLTRTSDGAQFFQTIVTPEGATGASSALSFADESFIRVGTNGLSSKQHAGEVSTVGSDTTTFLTDTVVNSGWAAANGAGTYKELDVSQSITVNDGSQDTLYNAFNLQQAANASGTVSGKTQGITQAVLITAGASTGVNTDDDLQKFVMKQASGTLNTSPHVLGSPVLLPGGAVTDVAWSAGDDVKVVWVGQQMLASNVESFRFQLYDNLTSAANDTIQDFEIGTTGTWSWVNPFDLDSGTAGIQGPTMTIGSP